LIVNKLLSLSLSLSLPPPPSLALKPPIGAARGAYLLMGLVEKDFGGRGMVRKSQSNEFNGRAIRNLIRKRKKEKKKISRHKKKEKGAP
jgi:hypothetical protein